MNLVLQFRTVRSALSAPLSADRPAAISAPLSSKFGVGAAETSPGSRLLGRCTRLLSNLFPATPPEHRAGFARALAEANTRHAIGIALTVALLNIGFGFLPELHYYYTGFWTLDPFHLTLTALHVFMALTSLGAVGFLLHARRRGPYGAEPWHHAFVMTYVSATLAAVTLFSVVEQHLTGSISAFLLGLAGFSTLFYSGARFSFGVIFTSFLGLASGSLWLHAGATALWHQLFVACDAALLFWIGSRVVFSLKVSNYLQLVTIEQQARELAASNAQLARANQFKTDLLSLAAHDLRDPLNSISIGAQTLRDDLPATSPLLSLVDGIDDSARRLSEFVGNLLTDITTDAHQIHLEPRPTPLPTLVAEILGRLRPVASVKSIELVFSPDAAARHAPPALVDPACFCQIVENLVTNAVKYSPTHKRVWIDLSHTPADGHRLAVRDEGAGLTAGDQARLFHRYQRLSARPTRGENSTGLGLFIVKHLVTLHHGRIWAESPGPGQGATFTVTLPSAVQ